MSARFFGSESLSLHGVYRPPRSVDDTIKSVLICPPIGHEYLRTHWALRLLAKQLARKGNHVLRFDYRGLGDSSGDPSDVVSIDQWLEDIDFAVEHLKEVSDADSVMMLGLRMGASMAAQTAARREDVNSVVLWEPVVSGSDYLRRLRKTHQLMIDLWYGEVETVNDESSEEVLGTLYRRELLDEIGRWSLNLDSLEVPQLVVQLQDDSFESTWLAWQKQLSVTDERSWDKLSDLELAWLRPRTSNMISRMIDEMFERLEQREMLSGSRELEGVLT
ncbi:MAG: alpha/beta fold hydrolase [Planctomycetota bacterium]